MGAVMEWLPVNDEVGAENEPCFDVYCRDTEVQARLKDGAHRTAGHESARRKSEIDPATNTQLRTNLPIDTDARNCRIVIGFLEVRMIAADCDNEVARMRIWSKPCGKSKTPSEVTVWIEDVRVSGQPSLHNRDTFIRNEGADDLQRYLCDGWLGGRQFRRNDEGAHADEVELELAPERNTDKKERIEQLERCEADAGAPEILPDVRSQGVAEPLNLRSDKCTRRTRIGRHLRRIKRCLYEWEVTDLVHRRHDELLVDTKAAGKSGHVKER